MNEKSSQTTSSKEVGQAQTLSFSVVRLFSTEPLTYAHGQGIPCQSRDLIRGFPRLSEKIKNPFTMGDDDFSQKVRFLSSVDQETSGSRCLLLPVRVGMTQETD